MYNTTNPFIENTFFQEVRGPHYVHVGLQFEIWASWLPFGYVTNLGKNILQKFQFGKY